MGGKQHTAYLPNEDQKLDNLRPGSGKCKEIVEKAESFNKVVQRPEEQEEEEKKRKKK